MKGLTNRQLEVVKLIYEGQKSGNTPTLVELAKKLNVSSRQTVKDLLDAIAKKGYLNREPKRARSIMLKTEAIQQVENKNYFDYMQLGFSLASAQTPSSYQWHNPHNIIIDQGAASNYLEQIIVDNNSLISLVNEICSKIKCHVNTQFVLEKSNFSILQNSTIASLPVDQSHMAVSPLMPNIVNTSGYLWIENASRYQLVWSGMNSHHYYHFGKEYGNTKHVSYIDGGKEQIKLFPQNEDVSQNCIKRLSKTACSWSRYVDFPIYCATLKKTSEILYWSHRIGLDVNDLRYFFLTDLTGTKIMSRDRVSLRDISYNFPNLIHNSTKYVFSN